MTDKFHIIIPPQDIACDPGLQKRLADGDRAAFAWVYKNYCQRLFDYALLMTSDAEKSEDIVQDVFIRLWEKRGKIREVENFNGYINTICRNQIVNEFRKDKRETEVRRNYATQVKVWYNAVGEIIDFKETNVRIHAIINQLPPCRREIFEMKLQGMGATEISKEFTIKAKTVWGQLYKAGKFLEEEFKREC